jgi:uncharacterized protein (TIGR02145 family)
MTKLNKKLNKTPKLAIFSSSLLVAASAVLLFAPIIRTNADSNANLKVETTINPVVSLAVDVNALDFNITPTSAGAFSSQPIVATVDTNSTGGYELYFSSEDSSTSMTSLVSESTIASDFSSTVTSTTMAANKWGYSLDNTNFSAIPVLATPTKIKDLNHFPAAAEKDTTVNIAVKIDSSLPSGAYSKKVVFSAVAHPSLVPSLHEITSMQQMTSEICAATTTPTTSATTLDWTGEYRGDTSRVPRKSLKDDRDGKYYLVSKLADGNCWMSQNLELILNKNTALTNDTTDLNTKTTWTPANNTYTTTPTTSNWPNSNTTAAASAYSYYPIASDRYYRGGTSKSSSPTASGTAYDWEKTGVYYNWFSATAGSGTLSVTTGSVNDSICPKGWRLPLGTTANKSYYYLLTTKYGATASSAVAAPLNFVRSGIYNYFGYMGAQGEQGMYWSSTAKSQSATVYMVNSASVVDSLNSSTKGDGYTVRCVAR